MNQAYSSADNFFGYALDQPKTISPRMRTPTILLLNKQIYQEVIGFFKTATLPFTHGLIHRNLLEVLPLPVFANVTRITLSDTGHKVLDSRYPFAFEGHRKLSIQLGKILSDPNHNVKELELEFTDAGLEPHVKKCWNFPDDCDMRKWIEDVYEAWRTVRGIKSVKISGWFPPHLAEQLISMIQSKANPILRLPRAVRETIYRYATDRDNAIDNGALSMYRHHILKHEHPYTSVVGTPNVLLMDYTTSREVSEYLETTWTNIICRDSRDLGETDIGFYFGTGFLQNVRYLNVIVPDEYCVDMFHSLCNVLMEEHSLLILNFCLESFGNTARSRSMPIERLLEPLMSLFDIRRVTISGVISVDFANALAWSMMNAPDAIPPFVNENGEVVLGDGDEQMAE